MNCTISVIIAAGGSSLRYGEKDKLLEMLGDLPVFLHSVRNFSAVCRWENMVVAVRPEALEDYRCITGKFMPGVKVNFVSGGKDRSGSVRNALDFLPAAEGVVAVHDAARPLADAGMLMKAASRAAVTGGAVVGVRVVDSLKIVDSSGRISSPVSRDGLFRAETPQVFDIAALRKAYQMCAGESATDDAEIMRKAGFEVEVVETGRFNIKLTSPGDLELLRIFYNAGK